MEPGARGHPRRWSCNGVGGIATPPLAGVTHREVSSRIATVVRSNAPQVRQQPPAANHATQASLGWAVPPSPAAGAVIGDIATVVGLTSVAGKEYLNGREVRIVGWDGKAGRYRCDVVELSSS